MTTVEGERFYSCGNVIKSMGWREVTRVQASDDNANEDRLPEQTLRQHKKGEQKKVSGCKLGKSQTKPPGRHTEATLLTAMEKPGKFIENKALRESIKEGGLGTPATRAEIIEKLVMSSYIDRNGKTLRPTSKGRQLLDLVPPELKSPELTARWERRLADIAEGKEKKERFIANVRENARKLVRAVSESTANYRADNISKTKCPVCGKLMLLVNAKRGKMLSCPDRECGHRQPEKMDNLFDKRRSRGEGRRNQALISKYSGNAKAETNVGDLLKQALRQKEEKEGKK